MQGSQPVYTSRMTERAIYSVAPSSTPVFAIPKRLECGRPMPWTWGPDEMHPQEVRVFYG